MASIEVMSRDPRRKPTTTSSGAPVASDEHSLTVGPGGSSVRHDH
jgi:catalase